MEELTRAVEFNGQRITVANLDDHDLERLRLALDRRAREYDDSLEQARARRRRTGEFANRDWYIATQNALRDARMACYSVRVEQAHRAGDDPPPPPVSKSRGRRVLLCDCFVSVARQRLDPDLFDEMMASARAAYSAAQRPTHPY